MFFGNIVERLSSQFPSGNVLQAAIAAPPPALSYEDALVEGAMNDERYNLDPRFRHASDPSTSDRAALLQELGSNGYEQDMLTNWRNALGQYGYDPSKITNDQLKAHYQQSGFQRPKEQSFGDQLMEFAGPGSPIATIAASAFGGPVGGTIAAANGTGATQDAGINPAITNAIALAYGASNGGAGGATEGGGSYPSGSGGAMDMGQGMNGTYNYQSPAMAAGGQMYFDDYGNPLDFTPSAPGVGDAGAFDQFGSANSPNGLGPSGNIGDNYVPPSILDKIKGYATQLGLTPVALWKAIQGKVAGGGAAGGAAGGSDTLSQIIAALGPSILGVIGSGQQTAAYERLANQYAGYGAPYRQRLADLYADPSSFLKSPEVTGPVQQASDIAAHSLSTGGNPIASGNSLQQLQDYSANQLFGRLGDEKNRLANFGGLSTFNSAAPGAATSAINSNAGAFNSAGAGLANIFNPPQTIAQQMADFARLSQQASP
jgi:hypothetical protein